jgi:DNA-binding IclR family transcriptional regulator
MYNGVAYSEPRSTMRHARKPDNGSYGGVIAVARALALLESFQVGESTLSLAEMSRRAVMHKTTALRIARTLAKANYMVQAEGGQWRLGPAAGWLGTRYQAGFDVNNAVEPILHELAQYAGESATFYVREGSVRSCIARVEGAQAVRHHVRIGERLPLERGSPGRVILAFSGEKGQLYEEIRKRGYHITIGERDPQVGTVSAPVFGLDWRLLGAIGISGPATRLSRTRLEKHAKRVIQAANQLSYALAGSRSANTPPVVSKWRP